jgi:protein-S-isoprenylcysteine O-methyltransferase Ste14
MPPLPSRIYGIVFWVIMLWAFWPEARIILAAGRSGRRSDSADRGSIAVITFGTWAAYAIAIPVASIRAFAFAPAHRVDAFVGGMALLVAGSLLRRHCWRMLGASFTGDVRVRPDQEIVARGAYRILRHPSYTGGILMHTGVGLALGSWGSTLVLAAASFATYAYRIGVEERALAAVTGDRYRAFMRGRKRLIPYVY